MKKFVFVLVLIVLSINIGYSDCAFWLCNVDEGIIWDPKTNMKDSITNLILYFLTFLSLIAIAFVIKWGFQILTAGWDDEKVKSWKNTILYALLWVFIIIIAYSIVNIAFDAGESIQKLEK